jgi:CheY-like chemotaxis protein
MILVYVIEDNILHSQALSAQLSLAGMKFILPSHFGSIDYQLQEIRRHQPQVILLNPNIKALDGWEVLGQITNHDDNRHIPVVGYHHQIDGQMSEKFILLGGKAFYQHNPSIDDSMPKQILKIYTNLQKIHETI